MSEHKHEFKRGDKVTTSEIFEYAGIGGEDCHELEDSSGDTFISEIKYCKPPDAPDPRDERIEQLEAELKAKEDEPDWRKTLEFIIKDKEYRLKEDLAYLGKWINDLRVFIYYDQGQFFAFRENWNEVDDDYEEPIHSGDFKSTLAAALKLVKGEEA